MRELRRDLPFLAVASSAALFAVAGACSAVGDGGGATSHDGGALGDDAAPDGPVVVREGGAGACPGFDFCSDFEQPAEVEGWDAVTTKRAGSVTNVTMFGTETILVASLPEVASGLEGQAFLTKRFADATSIAAEFSVYVPSFDLAPGGEVTIASVGGQNDDEAAVAVRLRRGAPNHGLLLLAGDGSAATTDLASFDLPLHSWLHIYLQLVYGSPGRVRMTVNGSVAYSKAAVFEKPGTTRIELGLRYNRATPAVFVRYDTLRVNVTP